LECELKNTGIEMTENKTVHLKYMSFHFAHQTIHLQINSV